MHNRSWRRATTIVIAPILVTRLSVLAAGLAAAVWIGYDPLPTEHAAWRVSADALANLPARWDAYWYLDIATHGYQWQPGTSLQQNVVFFPAYPMLIRAVSWASGGPAPWCGVTVSLAAFAWALTVFLSVAAADIGEPAATRAVWLAAAYPFAIFYGAVYTESLFLLGLLSAWLACRDRRWAAAAAWGLLVGLSRPNGFLMSVPLACLSCVRDGGQDPAIGGERWRGIAPGLVAAAMPVLGMLGYSAFLGWRFGEPFAWLEGQAAWGTWMNGLATPPDPRWGPPLPWRESDMLVYLGNGAATVFALCGIIPIRRRLSLAHALVVGLSVLPPLVAHGILSMGRFSSVMFPLFVWLATVIPAGRQATWTGLFLAGQIGCALLFYSWRILV